MTSHNEWVQIDRDSPTPLYRQLRDQLRAEIVEGALAPGTKLASEREWITDLGVSRITIRQALGDLAREGVLTAVQGKGFYVAHPSPAAEHDPLRSLSEVMASAGVELTSELIEARRLPAPAGIAAVLEIPRTSRVIFLHRLRIADGVPIAEQRTWIPADLLAEVRPSDFEGRSLFEIFREHDWIPAEASTHVSARAATADEAVRLELPTPPVVLTVDQTTRTADQRVIEHCRSAHHPNRLPVQISQGTAGAHWVPQQEMS